MSLIYDFLNASECLPAGESLRHLLTNCVRMTNGKTTEFLGCLCVGFTCTTLLTHLVLPVSVVLELFEVSEWHYKH